MNYLLNAGYRTITLDQAYQALTGLVKLPAKPVIITFDDGGLDNYTVAFPILLAKKLTATFFIPTGYVGRKGHMTWEQLASMSKAGMRIESHTVHEVDLRALDSTRLSDELTMSRADIQQHLGVKVRFLAYPGGKYDSGVIAAARASGYLACVTVTPGTALSLDNVYAWPRLSVTPWETVAGFEKALP